MMRKLIFNLLNSIVRFLYTILSMYLVLILLAMWFFWPEHFYDIKTNDLIFISLLIILSNK